MQKGKEILKLLDIKYIDQKDQAAEADDHATSTRSTSSKRSKNRAKSNHVGNKQLKSQISDFENIVSSRDSASSNDSTGNLSDSYEAFDLADLKDAVLNKMNA